MQDDDQSDLISFFQISGIHGLPYVPWDGGDSQPVSTNGWEGYCTHGSVLFPTWHRPYMMLYEVRTVARSMCPYRLIFYIGHIASAPEVRHSDCRYVSSGSGKLEGSRCESSPSILGLGKELSTPSPSDFPADCHDHNARW
jgi:hypothetical protein